MQRVSERRPKQREVQRKRASQVGSRGIQVPPLIASNREAGLTNKGAGLTDGVKIRI